EGVLVDRFRLFEVVEVVALPGKVRSRKQRVVVVAEFAEEPSALVEVLLRGCQIGCRFAKRRLEYEAGVGCIPRIPVLGEDRERLLELGPCRRVVVIYLPGQHGSASKSLCTSPGRGRGRLERAI